MDKYALLTEMAKSLDERDHLREENDILERELHEFKVSSGTGMLTPFIRKVYEYGRDALFDTCFKTSWYKIGVNDSGGEPYPASSLDEWGNDVFSESRVPASMSRNEVFDVCKPLLIKAYDEKWEQEKSEWLAEHESEGE